MRTILGCTCLVMLIASLPVAGLADWMENFDSYTPGALPPQSSWTGWDGAPSASNFIVVADQFRSIPHSLRITGADDAVHEYTGYTSGQWVYTAWQGILGSASGVPTYFVIMNTYVSGSHQPHDWSVQVNMDPATNLVTDENSGGTAPLMKDQWVEIRVEIDLDADTRRSITTVPRLERLHGVRQWIRGCTEHRRRRSVGKQHDLQCLL